MDKFLDEKSIVKQIKSEQKPEIVPIQEVIKNDKKEEYLQAIGKTLEKPRENKKTKTTPVVKTQESMQQIESSKSIIKKLIIKSTEEIRRLKIEIDLHLTLIRDTTNKNEQSLYTMKNEAYSKDLSYHQKRIYELERMLVDNKYDD